MTGSLKDLPMLGLDNIVPLITMPLQATMYVH